MTMVNKELICELGQFEHCIAPNFEKFMEHVWHNGPKYPVSQVSVFSKQLPENGRHLTKSFCNLLDLQ